MRDGRPQTFTSVLIVLLSLVALMPVALNAQDDDESTESVHFAGHAFELPRSIANGFSAFIVDEATATAGSRDSLQPPRTEFRLLVYSDVVAASPAVGWVNIYNRADLEPYDAYAQYERLQGLLSERPDLGAETSLPTLYPYQRSVVAPDRYSEFFVHADYLETAGYQGISFVYGRVIYAGDRQSVLFYRVYFEGMSHDGQRYLSSQIEGSQDLIESLDSIIDRDEYVAQAQALFNQPTDEAIIAWIDRAQRMFSSFDYNAQP